MSVPRAMLPQQQPPPPRRPQSGYSGGGGTRYRQEAAFSAQHLEDARYLAHTWRRVKEECENLRNTGVDPSSLYYHQSAVHPSLLDFEPFDLEKWWGRRLYNRLTSGTT